MIRTILYVLIAEVWNTAGQLLFKKSANAFPAMQEKSFKAYGIFFKNVIRRPGILLGLSSMAVGLIFWLVALSQAALSVVFVLGSMRIFLDEKIDGRRFLGTLLIAIGIALVALAGTA
jgi:drug/metabolite transporter (DMT)-like permease